MPLILVSGIPISVHSIFVSEPLLIAHGDKKKAVQRLRGGSDHRTHHFSTFRSGLLLGLAVPALVSGIYLSYQEQTREDIPAWDGLLFVYAVFLVPVIFALLVGLNLQVWSQSRINYVFIFGEYSPICTGLAVFEKALQNWIYEPNSTTGSTTRCLLFF